MDKVTIKESGVSFGEFDPSNVFLIEDVLTKSNFGEGVKKVEFILKHRLKKNVSIVFLEARSSIPKEADDFFNEIKLKMVHCLTVFFTLVSGRHESLRNQLPQNLKGVETLQLPIKLLLVIPKIPDVKLEEINQKFKQMFRIEKIIWDIDYSHIIVMNEERARRYKLIKVNSH
jgi:hypothetical protein